MYSYIPAFVYSYIPAFLKKTYLQINKHVI